ncbi:type III toxin-antitoxin system ToxN/AbiQ family toxin [Bacillus sp. DJP31]|uniref:type III toxin-antitoxin system ToxN/AbiQ family toxin n=1 Tax=Bacillus sp. DJP31 TaxID=3409789 RepID=UPI003BB652F5
MENKIRFYEVTDTYIDYCRRFDTRVPENKVENRKHPRKYVGIFFEVEGFKYFAPLSSPKTKHTTMKEKVDFMKVEDDDGLYAVLNLNNMFPVPNSEIVEFEFDEIQDTKYRDLLEKEFLICRGRREKIIKNAHKVYEIVTVNKTRSFIGRCNDFKLLETKCKEYETQQKAITTN